MPVHLGQRADLGDLWLISEFKDALLTPGLNRVLLSEGGGFGQTKARSVAG